MSLAAGTRLGPYEILAPIGKGGMGEVYRARDTKLKRDVALKVLPEAFASDPERMTRFQREAEVLASLNHPNIAAIYGVVEDRALVMELVEGEPPKGPMPFEETWRIASQIAAALEYAHERGIVHRDLKPANIKVTPDGEVKLLDFGLAKALTNPREASPNAENSPTLTIAATEVGMILGTAAYMSPEQAKGRTVDKRADIWAFGVVLYELLTGDRLFKGEDVAEILAAVIKEDPSWDGVPVEMQHLLKCCLQKDPKNRLHDIADARLLLHNAPARVSLQPAKRVRWLWPSMAAVGSVAFLALALLHFRENLPESPVLKYTIAPPENSVINTFAISRDGRSVALAAGVGAQTSIWIRALDSLEARKIPGTDGAAYPFWSPDGRYLGFFAQGKLKKIAVNGGPAQSLADYGAGGGGTWNPDGTILFRSPLGALQRVASSGGAAAPLFTGKFVFSYPAFLPDGRRFLYSITIGPDEIRGVYVASLDSKDTRRLLPDASNTFYAPPRPGSSYAHLLFIREGTLMAQPVDPASLQPAGDLVPLIEQVAEVSFAPGNFSVSENGTLLYQTGREIQATLAWLDRVGKEIEPVGEPGAISDFALSPDERRIVFARNSAQNRISDLWIMDLAHGTASRFTADPSFNTRPVWSPDSTRIIFSSSLAGRTDLYQKLASGTAQEKAVLTSNTYKNADDWSRDGKFLLYQGQGKGADVFAIPLGGGKPIPVVETEFNQSKPQLSADGRWLAYVSDESGRSEVYVQQFSTDGRPAPQRWQVSAMGGTDPRWRRDGRELFYLAADQKLMSISLRAGSDFGFDIPQPLFALAPMNARVAPGSFRYAVTADAKRFLVLRDTKDAAPAPITVVTNWQAGFKK